MSVAFPFGSRETNQINRFVGPASDGPDVYRWEIYTDARGMSRADVLALIAALANQLATCPAPLPTHTPDWMSS